MNNQSTTGDFYVHLMTQTIVVGKVDKKFSYNPEMIGKERCGTFSWAPGA